MEKGSKTRESRSESRGGDGEEVCGVGGSSERVRSSIVFGQKLEKYIPFDLKCTFNDLPLSIHSREDIARCPKQNVVQ
jgi:hypothetical protein